MNEQKSKLVRKWAQMQGKRPRQVRKAIKSMNVHQRAALYAKMKEDNERHRP